MSSFQNSALIVKNLKTPKFTFSGLLWKNETSYIYIFWDEYTYLINNIWLQLGSFFYNNPKNVNLDVFRFFEIKDEF